MAFILNAMSDHVRHHGAKRGHAIITPRQQTPPDPGRPSLLQLPDDILFYIFNFVQYLNPETVTELAMVCSYLYRQARYVQSQEVTVYLGSHVRAHRRLDYLAQNNLLSAVRTLRVVGSGSILVIANHETGRGREIRSAPGQLLSRLASDIRRMTGLRDIHWHEGFKSMTPVPKEIVSALKGRPRTQLHLSFNSVCNTHDPSHYYPDHVPPQQTLATLENTPNLVSLKVRMFYSERSINGLLDTTLAVRRVLLSCANLQKLSLDFEIPGIYGRDPKYAGLGFSDGERPPALTDLAVTNYTWGGNPGKREERQYWADMFDWSQLRRLYHTKPHIARLIADRLTNLKEVELDYDMSKLWRIKQASEEAVEFLNNLPSILESITLHSFTLTGLEPIARHAAGLRKLVLHDPEGWRQTEDTPLSNSGWNTTNGFMTHYDLQMLCNTLPQLEELVIDMDRGGKERDEWPYSMLNILVEFPCLRQLGIWFELGAMGDRSSPPKPYLTMEAAIHLFSYILDRAKQNRLGSSPLVQVTFSAGTSDPASHPSQKYPSLEDRAEWSQKNATSFLCELDLHHPDGFAVTSPLLSNAANRKLDRIVRRKEPRYYHPEGDGARFRAALMGPLPLSLWNNADYRGRLRKFDGKSRGVSPAVDDFKML